MLFHFIMAVDFILENFEKSIGNFGQDQWRRQRGGAGRGSVTAVTCSPTSSSPTNGLPTYSSTT